MFGPGCNQSNMTTLKAIESADDDLVWHSINSSGCLIALGGAPNSETDIASLTSLCQACGQLSDFTSNEAAAVSSLEALRLLLKNRICNRNWLDGKPKTSWVVVMVQTLRLLCRDRRLQREFFDLHMTEDLVYFGNYAIAAYFESECPEATTSIRGFLSISQKIASTGVEDHIITLIESGLHRTVMQLLSSRDMVVLQAALQVLAYLCEQSERARVDICSTNVLDQTLQMIKDSDLLTQKHCVNLLRVLCCEIEAREQIKVYDGVAVLLSLLSTKNVRLQWHVAWTLPKLAEELEIAVELGQIGAISIIISELSEATESAPKSSSVDDWLTMLSGLCAVLALLCKDDTNTGMIVQGNGLHVMCRLLIVHLRQQQDSLLQNTNFTMLQCSLFRVLRMVFSLERNRHFFKRLFPPTFFAEFIDIGHYVEELAPFEPLVHSFREILKMEESNQNFLQATEALNLRNVPTHFVDEYAVLEQLGAGAFGCVYRVKKRSTTGDGQQRLSHQQFALKEIFMHSNTVEKEASEAGKSFGDVISEVKIIQKQMRHPNIVRYRKVFGEGGRLYILMDLIDGAPLNEHISSVREKGQLFQEDRLWKIIIQMVLALRYLHKEKRIIHRDLKPNNVMLAEEDRVVITDFGLAKERNDQNYLKSTTGTILYSCPEMIRGDVYGEKADMWSFGVIVYEMVMLKLPFRSQDNSLLYLANAIVEARYDRIPVGRCSEDLIQIIDGCLTSEPDQRLDIVGVAQLMSLRLLTVIDDVQRIQYSQLQKRMDITTSASCNSATAVQHIQTASPPGGTNGAVMKALSQDVPSRPRPPSARERSRTRPVKVSPGSAAATVVAGGVGIAASSVSLPQQLQQDRRRRTASATLPSIGTGGKKGNGGSVFSTTTGAGVKKNIRFAWQGDGDSAGDVVNGFSFPTIRRVNSSSSVEMTQRRRTAPAESWRISSAGSVTSVRIPSVKLKTITDPILELLSVLHSLMLVGQSPSDGPVNHKRRAVEQFRRRIFDTDNQPSTIKAELRKLAAQCPEPIRLNLGYADYRPVVEALEGLDGQEVIPYLTYEQLAACIQHCLQQQSTTSRESSNMSDSQTADDRLLATPSIIKFI